LGSCVPAPRRRARVSSRVRRKVAKRDETPAIRWRTPRGFMRRSAAFQGARRCRGRS
jgi:hypothetical protein